MTSIDVQMAQRGIITIPKPLRESYGMAPGDTLTLIDLGAFWSSARASRRSTR